MFRAITSACLSAMLASCSVIFSNDKPILRDKVSLEKGMIEGHRMVRGKVEVLSDPRSIPKLLVSERFGGQVQAYLPDNRPISDFPMLDPTVKYEVELLTRIYRNPDYVFNDVLRVSRNGTVIYDTSTCFIHHLPMERLLERGQSSCDSPRGFDTAREREFPNDGNTYLACGSGLHRPTWKCPACEKAYYAWCRNHGVKPSW
jgi:hypothetical protein